MQSTYTNHNPETRILSILRPGEMLRFVLVPDGERKIDFGIEGRSETTDGDELLADRLSLVLTGLRNQGYAFGKRLRTLSATNRSPGKRAKSRNRSAWVEIRPLTFCVVPPRLDTLGFGGTGAERVCSSSLRLPALPASLGGRILESPTMLVAALPQVELFEIEFVRTILPQNAAKDLEEALRFQTVAQQAFVQTNDATLSQMFLAQWLWHRTGWRVTARARLVSGGNSPVASLEMIGRDLFMCECEVVSSVNSEQTDSTFDLRNAYPRDWPFPPLFPPSCSLESLAASRLHNLSLPELPKKGLKIGRAEGADIRLPTESRDRHIYIAGATGTGKSTLVARMIKEDIKRGEGVILLDPHGDLFFEILEFVPDCRREELTVIDPASDAEPPGLNFLDVAHCPRPAWRLRFMINELLQFFDGVWDLRNVGGPMFEMYFRNAILLLGDEGVRERSCHSLLNFASLMADKEFRSHQLEVCRNTEVKDFWKTVAERAGGDCSLANITPYIVSKMDLLTQSSFIRKMIGSPKDTLRVREKMDRNGIILCNLSKGTLGAHESRLLGSLLVAQIFAAGLERGMKKRAHRRPVNIYVDEFQNFVSDNVASMLSEARKFGLRLTLANQTLSQLKASSGKQDLLETVLGNVGNIILFRLGVPDSEKLKLFIEPFTRQEMQELPNFHAMVRLLTGEGPVRPLIMQTLKE